MKFFSDLYPSEVCLEKYFELKRLCLWYFMNLREGEKSLFQATLTIHISCLENDMKLKFILQLELVKM
jgi:hypothetical protein